MLFRNIGNKIMFLFASTENIMNVSTHCVLKFFNGIDACSTAVFSEIIHVHSGLQKACNIVIALNMWASEIKYAVKLLLS